MKERPILFSGPMVKALLAGTKTQTRRLLKSQPGPHCRSYHRPDGQFTWVIDSTGVGVSDPFYCPYGEAGDRLWVRETSSQPGGSMHYRADDDDHSEVWKWKPSIFMRRAESRIALEITDVRVERLNAISEGDAMAEGIIKQTITLGRTHGRPDYDMFALRPGDHCDWECTAQTVYRKLWESINGAGSWALNPFVWALTFRIVENKSAAA